MINKPSNPQRWKVLIVGMAANITFSMVVGGLPASAIFMRSSYQLSNLHLGWVLAILGLGITLSELPWGILTDKLGDKIVLIIGLLSTATILLLMSFFVVPKPNFIPSLSMLAISLLLIGILCAPQFAIITFASVFLHDYAKVDIATISVSLAIIQIGAIVSRVWAGQLTDKLGNRKQFLRTCSFISLIAFLLLAAEVSILTQEMLSNHMVVFSLVALVVIAGIFVSAWQGVAFTELATLAGIKRTGTALAMGNTAVYSFFFITPIVIPLLLTLHNWEIVWFTASLCAFVALILFPKQQSVASYLNTINLDELSKEPK